MLHLIAASAALLMIATPPQEQEIPALTKDIILELLRFELPDIDPEQIVILEVRQLEELGRVNVRIGAVEAEIQLNCQRTDFGPKWRLAAELPDELRNAGKPEPPPQETPQEESQEENPAGMPVEPKDGDEPIQAVSYKSFLKKFFDVVIAENEEAYEGFYFQESDFNFVAVASKEDPQKELADKRVEFIRQCVQLSLQLRNAGRFDTISFFATRSSRSERAELKALMPQTKRYIKAVSVEVMVDGRLGTIEFEGLTLMPDGWRLGGIAKVEIAPQASPEPSESQ